MKKLIVFALTLFALVSCTGPMGPMGPQGPQGSNAEGDQWIVDEFTVNEGDWLLYGTEGQLGSYYYCDLNDQNLSEWIYDNGSVEVYLFDNSAERGWIQQPLPITRFKSTDEGFLYQEEYDFDYSVGKIRVYVTYNDFATSNKPSAISFRSVKQWWLSDN